MDQRPRCVKYQKTTRFLGRSGALLFSQRRANGWLRVGDSRDEVRDDGRRCAAVDRPEGLGNWGTRKNYKVPRVALDPVCECAAGADGSREGPDLRRSDWSMD